MNDAGSRVSNESANVDLVLLTEDEYAEFHRANRGSILRMTRFVDTGGPKTKVVKADFTASFD